MKASFHYKKRFLVLLKDEMLPCYGKLVFQWSFLWSSLRNGRTLDEAWRRGERHCFPSGRLWLLGQGNNEWGGFVRLWFNDGCVHICAVSLTRDMHIHIGRSDRRLAKLCYQFTAEILPLTWRRDHQHSLLQLNEIVISDLDALHRKVFYFQPLEGFQEPLKAPWEAVCFIWLFVLTYSQYQLIDRKLRSEGL